MNWISVEDFLPGLGLISVIVRLQNGWGIICYSEALYMDGSWALIDSDGELCHFDSSSKVTHWTHIGEVKEKND